MKKGLLSILGLSFFILICLSFFVSAAQITLILTQGNSTNVVINGFTYSINLNSINSLPQINVSVGNVSGIINLGATQQINRLNISFTSGYSGSTNAPGSATISIYYNSCTPNLQCSNVGTCLNGFQNETCTDLNGCVPPVTNSTACTSTYSSVTVTNNSSQPTATTTSGNQAFYYSNNNLMWIGIVIAIVIIGVIIWLFLKIKKIKKK
jgi:hypothetical protein